MNAKIVKLPLLVMTLVLAVTACSTTTTPDENSQTSFQTSVVSSTEDGTLEITQTDLYKFLSTFENQPTVKVIAETSIKNGKDVKETTTHYYHPGGNIEVYTNKSGDKCAVMTDVDTNTIYAINQTKNEYFVFNQEKPLEDVRCSYKTSFYLDDFENADCYQDDEYNIVIDKTQDSGIIRSAYKRVGADGVIVNNYTLTSVDDEPVHVSEVHYRFSVAEPGELEQFAIADMKEQKFDDGKTHTLTDTEQFWETKRN